MKTAVFCVGNRLMLDDGIGPAVYDEMMSTYDLPADVTLYDVGCMSMDMVPKVDESDLVITVDAVDGTDADPGTVFRFKPEDMARNMSMISSLHDLKLADLFDAASLLGYSADGICLGMQVANMSPAEFCEGLTPLVYEALPRLVETLLAELVMRGYDVRVKETGESVEPGYQHVVKESEVRDA